MASAKTDIKRRQKDGVVNSLKDLFGNVLHIDIIYSVASECDFDVERSSNVLLEMTNNIDAPPKPKDKPKKRSPQNAASPKKAEPKAQPAVVKSRKTIEYERVINMIRSGYKVLVILRGLPGSGKSRLATVITDVTLGPGNNSHHILSTDDFFVQQRGYVYDSSMLHEAHNWNQRRAFQAMSRGLSPVVVDNTNTQMWEMKPYATMATDYGYIVEILEPDTWWAFNDKELAKRNSHGVPRAKIKDMLDRYEKNVTTQKLLCAYNLAYKFQKPPQYRLVPPPVLNNGFVPFKFQQQNGFVENIPKSHSTPALDQTMEIEMVNLMEFSEIPKASDQPDSHPPPTDNPDFWTSNPVDKILMCTEDTPVEILQPNPINATPARSEPTLFPDIENAWGVDEKALQSWDIVTPITCESKGASVEPTGDQEQAKPETRDDSTCVEPRDYLKGGEVPFGYRVIDAQTRDINVGSPARNFSPRKKTMVDQSCMTVDADEEEEDEEKRINDLLDLFPKVPKSSLRELYYKCNKNFYWTVDVLIDDDNLEVAAKEQEEGEEEEEKLQEEQPVTVESSSEEDKEATKEKVFKRKTISDDSHELKTCLESKFDISKEHYSEHVYKVKQTKFGGVPEPQPSTSAMVDSESDLDSDDDDSSNNDDPKNMIELNLGDTFVDQLETLFGGDFPRGFQPVVQMPIALARQIYSFYVESICQQMEAQNHILDRLVKEDEDFARKLQSEEVSEDKRSPTFTEIVDEQIAMNLHRRDVDEWKNMTADNLAAKLTKQKLFEAFPSVEKEILLEIWHAYNYDYNKTVEVLIASVGAENVNGTERIKEPPLSKTTLEEMKAAEENCGELEEHEVPKPATYYREEANKHLKKRAELFEKAKSYHQRGMTEVAMFYSELAKKETQFYDKANHFAAAAFIEEHSKRLQKFDTLDLHYFYVKEAIANLDMFIDRNINLLKGSSKRGQDLFVITGRGKNSEGGRSKIKPAVMTRLQKRNIGYIPLNPGLLKIRVLRDSLITSDIP